MARKRRPIPVLSPEQLSIRGSEQMAAGRYREAVDTHKKLLKQEPGKDWETSLGLAYSKRAEELVGKAMYKEALMLLGNAERLSSTPQRPDVALTCLIHLGHFDKVLSLFFQAEQQLREESAKLFPFFQESVAVLLLTDPFRIEAVPKDSPWHGQLAMAQKAIRAYAQGDDADLEQHLRTIPLRSPFKSLRLILKSLITTDNTARALRLLEPISDHSPWAVLARAARLRAMEIQTFLQTVAALPTQERMMSLLLRG